MWAFLWTSIKNWMRTEKSCSPTHLLLKLRLGPWHTAAAAANVHLYDSCASLPFTQRADTRSCCSFLPFHRISWPAGGHKKASDNGSRSLRRAFRQGDVYGKSWGGSFVHLCKKYCFLRAFKWMFKLKLEANVKTDSTWMTYCNVHSSRLLQAYFCAAN